jgi:hypothetical protein
VLGAIAAIVGVLPALGVDIRIFNGDKSMTAGRDTGSGAIPKWRWWITFSLACLALFGAASNLWLPYRTSSPMKTDLHFYEKPITASDKPEYPYELEATIDTEIDRI